MIGINHIGQDVWFISGFPYIYSGANYQVAPTGALWELNKDLEKLNHKYLVGITANIHQELTGNILKYHNFRPVSTFYSSHGKHETLTIWTKTMINAPDLSGSPITNPYGNCSISFSKLPDYDPYHNCVIAILKDKVTLDAIKSDKRFKRIKNTPIYFSIKTSAFVRKGR